MTNRSEPELLRDVLARSLPAALLEALSRVQNPVPANENGDVEQPTAAEGGDQ